MLQVVRMHGYCPQTHTRIRRQRLPDVLLRTLLGAVGVIVVEAKRTSKLGPDNVTLTPTFKLHT